MESTGEYWHPVYNLLEGHCTVLLVNAAHVKNEQIPRSSRRNGLPTKRINGALLMGHEHPAGALVELMQIRKTPSGTDRVLHHAPETFDGIEVMATMGR